jgi:hypothetical protein
MLPRTGADPQGPGVPTTGPNAAGRKQGSAGTIGDGCFVRAVAERNIAAGDEAGTPTTGGTTLERYSGLSFAERG